METWQIVLIVSIAIVLIIYLLNRQAKIMAASKPQVAGGAGLVQAATQIPVYGAAVKAVATVGKPVNHALDKVNAGITSGLQHIPVVGNYLAIPNQVAGSAITKVNKWLGLD